MSARETFGVNKEMQMGPPFHYIDELSDLTTAAFQAYVVGANAYAVESGRLPPFFVAKKVTILCTQDVQIRFNNARALVITVPANTRVVFDILTSIIYYRQDTVAGTLTIWFQG